MKIFKFCDFEVNNLSEYKRPLISGKYELGTADASLYLFDFKEFNKFSYIENYNYAVGDSGEIYLWDDEENDYISIGINIPNGAIINDINEGLCLITSGVVKQEVQVIDIHTKKCILNERYRGFCIYFDGSNYVIEYNRGKGIVSYNLEQGVNWSYLNDYNNIKTIKDKGISFFLSGTNIFALDLVSGNVIFSRECLYSILGVENINEKSYIFLSDFLWVFDHDINDVIKEIPIPKERDVAFLDQYLFIADRTEGKINCYEKLSLKLIKTLVLEGEFRPTGGGFLICNNVAVIALGTGLMQDQVGLSYRGIFSLDDFFSDNFQQEIEPDYFEVHEEADIEGGNNLRITLDTSINFDTQYRHLSVALQNIPFRHGNYGWAATLDEEKPVNENFNGKVIADLSDHVFTPEQRDLLEEVIQEAMEFYANRQITSGDGKGTPCYVVSVIPVAE